MNFFYSNEANLLGQPSLNPLKNIFDSSHDSFNEATAIELKITSVSEEEFDRLAQNSIQQSSDLKLKETSKELNGRLTNLRAAESQHGNKKDLSDLEKEYHQKINGLLSKSSKKITAAISKSGFSKADLDILEDIFLHCSQHLHEVLKGAHVRLEDGGALYGKWAQLNARERISSHPSVKDSKQYGIEGEFIHECLFGIVEKKSGEVMTFFQLENTPWAPGLGNRAGHTADAIQYLLTKKNIGPYGSSVHTDKNPILIK